MHKNILTLMAEAVQNHVLTHSLQHEHEYFCFYLVHVGSFMCESRLSVLIKTIFRAQNELLSIIIIDRINV